MPLRRDEDRILQTTYLEPGLHVNVFQVSVPDEPVAFMVLPYDKVQDIRRLREEIEKQRLNAHVYGDSEAGKVFGYGTDMEYLQDKGFERTHLTLWQAPRLTARLIIEGMRQLLESERYDCRFSKGRLLTFSTTRSVTAASGRIRVYQGFDLRSIYWRDQSSARLAFGLVVDVAWAVRSQQGEPLGMREVAKFGAVTQVGQIQGEYLPGSPRINTEVARQRLQDQIMPFVREHQDFALPCGVRVKLTGQPMRVVLGGAVE